MRDDGACLSGFRLGFDWRLAGSDWRAEVDNRGRALGVLTCAFGGLSKSPAQDRHRPPARTASTCLRLAGTCLGQFSG